MSKPSLFCCLAALHFQGPGTSIEVHSSEVHEDGDIDGALSKLMTLCRKVDGCPDVPTAGETADHNDWIVDCDSQREIRELIDLLIANLGG